jgi:hypothetical protein
MQMIIIKDPNNQPDEEREYPHAKHCFCIQRHPTRFSTADR